MQGSTEASLPWGGDFSLTSTGDLMLVSDSPSSATATMQRLIRLINTCPVVRDANGYPIMPPDDIFHPDFGAGLPARVGDTVNNSFLPHLQSTIIGQLLNDPTVAPAPSPQVTATLQPDFKTVIVDVTVWLRNGQVLALPSIPMTADGA